VNSSVHRTLRSNASCGCTRFHSLGRLIERKNFEIGSPGFESVFEILSFDQACLSKAKLGRFRKRDVPRPKARRGPLLIICWLSLVQLSPTPHARGPTGAELCTGVQHSHAFQFKVDGRAPG
jgi:hypothetical protein